MESRAKLRYYRSSPRKVRLVADMVRGKAVEPALTSLQLSPKYAAHDVAKLVRSALANLEQAQPGVDVDRVFISKIFVDDGPRGFGAVRAGRSASGRVAAAEPATRPGCRAGLALTRSSNLTGLFARSGAAPALRGCAASPS